MARTEPTEEQLQEAWRSRRQADWPATFDEAMVHPLYRRLIRMHATHAAVLERISKRTTVITPGMPAPWDRRHAPASAPPIFDRKRAASGERDED
jgi:hypothetical protein